jgi:hypothetical protein
MHLDVLVGDLNEKALFEAFARQASDSAGGHCANTIAALLAASDARARLNQKFRFQLPVWPEISQGTWSDCVRNGSDMLRR